MNRYLSFFKRRASTIAVFVITVFGYVLRRYHLGYKSLWLDEAVIYSIAQGSIHDILQNNALHNSAPPLFALFLRLVTSFGTSETILRSLSLAAGVFAIPVFYFFARKFMGRVGAVGSALIVAIAPVHVQYSQELREYSIVFLLSCLLLIGTIKISGNLNNKRILFLAIVGILSILTQYGLVILLSVCSAYLVICLLKDKLLLVNLKNLIVLFGLYFLTIIFVYLTTLRYQFNPDGFGGQYLGRGYWDGSLDGILILLFNNTHDLVSFSFPLVQLVIALMGIGLYSFERGKRWDLILVCLGTIILTIVLALFRYYPFLGARQMMFFLPFIYLLMGGGIEFLITKKAYSMSVVILTLLVIVGFVNSLKYIKQPSSEDMRPIAVALRKNLSPNDRIYIYYGATPAFKYYSRNDNFQNDIIFSEISRDYPDRYMHEVDLLFSKQVPGWMIFSHCWQDECQEILEYAATIRDVQPILLSNGAYLYYAP